MEALTHLVIVWIGVYVAAYAARLSRLTPVLFFLFVGFVLGNAEVLPREPLPFIASFAEMGILIVMFALGFEESTDNFIVGVKRSWGIALFGALGPFACAYLIADYFWGDTNLSIMFGLTMTATAVSLTMVSLKSEGIHRSKAATGIMASAVLDDIGSLIAVAILVPLATSGGTMSLAAIGMIAVKSLLFFVVAAILGSWIFPHAPSGLIRHIPILRSIGIKHFLQFDRGEYATLTVLVLAVLVGIIAHEFGIHPAVGAYMAGLILKEEFFQFHEHEDGNHFHRTKVAIDQLAFSWIGPVFFVVLGTKIVFDMDILVSVLPQTALLFAGTFFVQVSSAGLAARYTAGFSGPESLMIGFGMLGRAELAFVVMDIAYIQNAILSDEAFYTLMFAIFWLNVAVPITIKWWKPYFNGEKSLFT